MVVRSVGASAVFAAVGEIPPGGRKLVTIRGREIGVFNLDGEFFALINRCPHQGAPLHKGMVRFGGSLRTVQCPLHGSTFDLADGRVMRGPATEPARAYETRVSEGVVEIRPR